LSITPPPSQQWQHIVTSVQQELFSIAEDERQWIEQHLANIHELQLQMQQLFTQADGLNQCCQCQGGCCDHGHNHMTLVNLLSSLLAHKLPKADFNKSCPFMGSHGCTLTVETRPFNCVTFICDKIENRMSASQREEFYDLEHQLRAQYLAFDQRFIGSSMRGLLIRSTRMAGNKFLAHV